MAPREAACLGMVINHEYIKGTYSIVIFHKRVRVFYQGFQTPENNGIHEAVYQAIFIVLENL